MTDFYLNENVKLDIFYISKIRCHVIKNNPSVLFIKCTEINWKTSVANILFISILLKNMGWDLGIIGKLDNP